MNEAKFITRVAFAFNPFKHATRPLRDLMTVVTRQKFSAANDKCRLQVRSSSTVAEPYVEIEHKDKKVERFTGHEVVASKELCERVLKYARQLAAQNQ